MESELLKNTVWLACLAAEAVILLYARSWLAEIEGSGRRAWPAVAASAGLVGALGVLLLGGEALFGARLASLPGYRFEIYRWVVWNLVVTAIVIVEQVILVYLMRLDGLLRGDAGGETVALRGIGALLAGGTLMVYAAYVYGLIAVTDAHRLDADGIANVSAFFCRIGCAACVMFEWLIAVWVVRVGRVFLKAA